jgi:hypothetical protein
VFAATIKEGAMSSKMLQVGAMTFAGLVLLTVPSRAGPCAKDIARMEVRINAWLDKQAASGPTKRQSVGAQMQRQPTPRSMAEAEGVPAATIAKARDAMERARKADSAGDVKTCEAALAEIPPLLER